jgi:arabinan endo-1,5-alpha-L-arabinosidase
MKPSIAYRLKAGVVSAVLFGALASLLPTAARAATSGNNGTHDPSRIIESNGRFYFCSTGGGCASSTDGLAWTSTGLRITVPSWSTTYAPGGNQGVWAPDIIFYNGTYHIYYAVAGLPATHAPCFIGLYTTPTLDSTAANFKLTDQGMVVNNPTNTSAIQFSTIDPGPIIDPTGNLWTSWGSGYGKDTSKLQIWATRLDTTGLPLTSDPAWAPPDQLGYGLETGGIEASYVYFHDGYYYLFWNSGGCCSGASSTYTIHVARAQTLTGPYGTARTFYASNGSIHGPGHIGIYDACGAMRFTYHYYPDTGGSVLGENELSWGSDGFPVAGSPSTTPLKPCGQLGSSGPGGMGGTTGGGGGPGTGGTAGMGGGAGSHGSGGNGAGADSGNGGGPGTGGVSPSGGATGSGGAATSGSGGATGSGGDGGTATASGGMQGSSGGSSETGGNDGLGGSSGSPDASTGETSPAGGCACEIHRARIAHGGTAFLLLVTVALGARRSRRR